MGRRLLVARSVMAALVTAAVVIAGLLSAADVALAQTDEIQVYDGTMADPGVFNLTLHNNFTPKGLRVPAFPGAEISDRSLNGVPEWALGISDWLEGGLYLPLYSVGTREGRIEAMVNGVKLRALFAVPRAGTRRFFYGVNFEFSYNSRHWDRSRITSEIRPIAGWRTGRLDFIVNPILDTAYDGLRNVEFSPAARVAYNFSESTALAVEEYAGFGPLHRFYPAGSQAHQLFAVFNRNSRQVNVEAGVGFGLTNASDRITLKLILSKDLR